jgi:hypothetical protein
MRLCLVCAALVIGLLACGGLAQDINKGAGTTEREVSKGTGHDRTFADAAPGSASDASDAGAISM